MTAAEIVEALCEAQVEVSYLESLGDDDKIRDAIHYRDAIKAATVAVLQAAMVEVAHSGHDRATCVMCTRIDKLEEACRGE